MLLTPCTHHRTPCTHDRAPLYMEPYLLPGASGHATSIVMKNDRPQLASGQSSKVDCADRSYKLLRGSILQTSVVCPQEERHHSGSRTFSGLCRCSNERWPRRKGNPMAGCNCDGCDPGWFECGWVCPVAPSEQLSATWQLFGHPMHPLGGPPGPTGPSPGPSPMPTHPGAILEKEKEI